MSRYDRLQTRRSPLEIEACEDRLLLSFTPFGPITPEFQVNVTSIGDQEDSATAGLEDGRFAVVWEGQSVHDYGISVRVFEDDGTPITAEIPVNQTTDNNQWNPDIAALHGGGFVVVWQSRWQDGSHFGIYARLFDPQGEALSDEILINQTTLGDQQNPSVSDLADGGFVVSWQGDGGGRSTHSQVYARIFDPSGNPDGGEVQVNQDPTAIHLNPDVAGLENGGYVVTWQRGSYPEWDVRARLFNASSVATTGDIQVNLTTSDAQYSPSVDGLHDGGFLIAWTSRNQLAGTKNGIYARSFSAFGTPTTGEFGLNAYEANSYAPSVTSHPVEHVVVVSWYTTDKQAGDADGIAIRKIYADGSSPTGWVAEYQVNDTNPNDQFQPSASHLSNGDVVVSWTSDNQDGSENGVFARVLDGGPRRAPSPPFIKFEVPVPDPVPSPFFRFHRSVLDFDGTPTPVDNLLDEAIARLFGIFDDDLQQEVDAPL